MHRFCLPPEQCEGKSLLLEGREVHHAARVLRIQTGEQVAVLNGKGMHCLCSVEAVRRGEIQLTVLERSIEPKAACDLVLFQAITKGRSMDMIIQKATELGVDAIQPVLSERVEVKTDNHAAAAKAEKWKQVAVEALKQCGGAWLPEISIPLPLNACVSNTELPELSMVGALSEATALPGSCLSEFERHHGRMPISIGIWIGPEGDFSSSEYRQIIERGIRPVSLGTQVLRSETAAIYSLAVVSHELQIQRMGGRSNVLTEPAL